MKALDITKTNEKPFLPTSDFAFVFITFVAHANSILLVNAQPIAGQEWRENGQL
jgi:hypothetical protein